MQPGLPLRGKIPPPARYVNRQIRIAVEDEKFIAEQRQRAFDGAARAQQFRAVERIIQPDAKRAAVAKIALDHFAEMADAQAPPGGGRGRGAIRADAPKRAGRRRKPAIWVFFP